ncbi:proteoglycan 4-like [Clinocottus analis]|uniref:proteoglycan 4-like n=1 Tax=Clinocottus analis TaxID=304258 RepID=UPI0035C064F0
MTVVEKEVLSPTKGKSEGLKVSPELATTELKKTTDEPCIQKSSSTPEVITAPSKITVVEKSKPSQTKRKSKDLQLSPTFASTKLTNTKEEPDTQKPSSTPGLFTATPETTVVEKADLSPIKIKSKALELSPDLATTDQTKTKEKPEGQKPSSTPELVTTTTEVFVVEKGQLSPTKGKSKGLKLSPDLAPTELTPTKEKPETKKPSSTPTPEMVKETTEVTFVEKGKLSPTKGKPKGLKLSPDLATKELTPTKEKPETKKPSSTPEMETETTEVTVVKKGQLSPTKLKSKDLKLSPDLAPTEQTKTKEKPEGQKPSSTPELVTTTTEVTVVEKRQLSSDKEKSKRLKPSPDLAPTELTPTKEKPQTKKPSSTPEMVTETSQMTVVEKEVLSPTKGKSEGLKVSPELATTELKKTTDEPCIQKSSSTPEVITAPSKITVVEKSKPSQTKRKSKDLQLSPTFASTKLTNTKEESDTQKPSSTPEVFTATPETTVVEKADLSPIKIKSKALELSPDLATTEQTKTKEKPEGQKPSSSPEADSDQRKTCQSEAIFNSRVGHNNNRSYWCGKGKSFTY